MKRSSIRTSIDVPADLHRRLREAAARRGCSARHLILHGIETAVNEAAGPRRLRRLKLDCPVVPTRGKSFDLTSEQIYELIGLP